MKYEVYSKERLGDECSATFSDYGTANEYFQTHLHIDDIIVLVMTNESGAVCLQKRQNRS